MRTPWWDLRAPGFSWSSWGGGVLGLGSWVGLGKKGFVVLVWVEVKVTSFSLIG